MTEPTAPRPRAFSGIQPTADSFHFGNYLGALRNWVALQDTHDALYCVVDLHAITAGHEPDQLRRRTRVAAAQLLAIGLDPARCSVYVQSHVTQHAELGWILGCLTGFGEASRMTQFKDRAGRLGSDRTTVGFFSYPILQAADILLYRTNSVPVGEDQRQHLELSRDLAQRFNTSFGKTLVLPEPYIIKETGRIFDLQDPTAKMSKSAESQSGVLDLLDDTKALTKKVKSAVTDTGREVVFDAVGKPGISNLLTIFSTITGRSVAELETAFAGKGYGDFKGELAAAVVDFVAPIQQRFHEFYDDADALDAVLAAGAAQAQAIAAETMAVVRERMGFVGAPP
jgi:tryptophanyl-tRNA synthetase